MSCAACKKPLTGDIIDIDDNMSFHEVCFKCAATNCKKPLEEYFEEKGKFYCSEKCIPKGGPPAAEGAPTKIAKAEVYIAVSCNGCGVEFKPKEEYIVVKPKDANSTTAPSAYHDKCFVCDECKEPIGNLPYGVSHGKPIHEKCSHGAIVSKTQGANEFEENLICATCKDRIRGRNKSATINGVLTYFHLTCLKCSKCGLGIRDDMFVENDAIICHRCHK